MSWKQGSPRVHPRAAAVCMGLLIAGLLSALAPPAHAQGTYDPTDELAVLRAEVAARGYSWVVGETTLSRIPPAERWDYLGLDLPPGQSGILPPDATEAQPTGRELPVAWDWRENGGVTPVKNQGPCGSCWDFGATAAFESAILILTQREVDLSEQQVLVCNTAGCHPDRRGRGRALLYLRYNRGSQGNVALPSQPGARRR